MSEDLEMIDYFKLCFTDAVIYQVWRETNTYAQQYVQTNAAILRIYSNIHEYIPTNGNEMKAFLSLCIIMGISYKP